MIHGLRLSGWLAFLLTIDVGPAMGSLPDVPNDPPAFPIIENSVLAGLGREDPLASLDLGDDLERFSKSFGSVIVELASRGLGDDPAAPLAALAAIRLDTERVLITRALLPLRDPDSIPIDQPILQGPRRDRAKNRMLEFVERGLDRIRRGDFRDPAGFDDAMSSAFAPLLEALLEIEPDVEVSPWPVAVSRANAVPPRSRNIDHTASADAERWARNLPEDHPLRTASIEAASRPRGDEWNDEASFPADRVDVLLLRNAWNLHGEDDSENPVHRRLLEIADWSSASDRREAFRLWVAIADMSRTTPTVPIARTGPAFRNALRVVVATHRRGVNRARNAWLAGTRSADRFDADTIESEVSSLRDSTSNLARVGLAEDVARALGDIAPEHAPPVNRQVAVWSNGLGGVRTRKESAGIVDHLHHTLAGFPDIDLDASSEDDVPLFASVTGGREVELREAMEEAGRRWVEAVGRGEARGGAESDLQLIHRLVVALDRVRGLPLDTDDLRTAAERCNDWGAWYVDESFMDWCGRTLVASARIATISAIDGSMDRLEGDVKNVERGLLLVEVVRSFDEGLRRCGLAPSNTAAASVATLAQVPGPNAWGLRHRLEAARIGRATAELQHLRTGADAHRRAEIDAWLRSACSRILDRVSPSESTPPHRLPRNRDKDDS